MRTKTTDQPQFIDQEDDEIDWAYMPGHVAKRVREALDKYEADRQRILSENAALRSAAQVAADALDKAPHSVSCEWWGWSASDENLFDLDRFGEGPCTCLKYTALSGLRELGIEPKKP